MTIGVPSVVSTERGPGLGRVLSLESQTVSVQPLRLVVAEPLLVTVNLTVISPL